MTAKSETLEGYHNTEIKIKNMHSAINVQGFTAPPLMDLVSNFLKNPYWQIIIGNINVNIVKV